MMKKRVPDWLNSSLWSSPNRSPSPPHTPQGVAPKTTAPAVAEAPVPVPPPTFARPAERPASSSAYSTSAAKGETRNPLSGHSGNSSSVCNSDDENGSSSANSPASAGAGPGAVAPPAAVDTSRQAQILQELSRKVINMGELRKLASQGIPDGAVIIGYLPTDRSLWPSEVAKKRSQYKNFKEELLMNPSEIARKLEKASLENHEVDRGSPGYLSRSEISHGEHPLSLGKSSIWNQFFQDAEIMEQIDRDVMRTHPDIHFFSGDSTSAKSNQVTLISLFCFCSFFGAGIRYVQGMNEILAPLYFVLKNDPNEENAASAEADAFFCFVELLSGFRDNFVQQLDNSVVGIRATITRLSRLLKEHDEELWRHLEMTTKVNPQFYAFRWITLLLTQEFNFADSLIIWDTLLSDPDGPQETLLRICCAMLVIVRKRLLAGDFTSNLKLLQNYPVSNISHILYVASKLQEFFSWFRLQDLCVTTNDMSMRKEKLRFCALLPTKKKLATFDLFVEIQV
ncbi:TBC1 domain family member 13 [Sesamum angolense]|uniref:TBC1 domain family member 13 n=1 Tax=Sesamum angolense TaxID=2727404 RepID=A0AAE1X2M7_9LAMI|nr:TBC1 domain family member 13 [Sesamum angolense]